MVWLLRRGWRRTKWCGSGRFTGKGARKRRAHGDEEFEASGRGSQAPGRNGAWRPQSRQESRKDGTSNRQRSVADAGCEEGEKAGSSSEQGGEGCCRRGGGSGQDRDQAGPLGCAQGRVVEGDEGHSSKCPQGRARFQTRRRVDVARHEGEKLSCRQVGPNQGAAKGGGAKKAALARIARAGSRRNAHEVLS